MDLQPPAFEKPVGCIGVIQQGAPRRDRIGLKIRSTRNESTAQSPPHFLQNFVKHGRPRLPYFTICRMEQKPILISSKSFRAGALMLLLLPVFACSTPPTKPMAESALDSPKSCEFRARNETAMRGSAGLQAYDAFDTYFSCLRERSQALKARTAASAGG